MRRLRPLALFLLLPAALLAALNQRAAAQKGEFGTVLKGRVVWEGKIPERQKIDVKVDAKACGSAIVNENLLINPKNQGVQGAFVWLAAEGGAALPVHEKLKAVPKDMPVMDQPKCMFVPRSLAIREGQTVLFKNSAQITHNVNTPNGDPVVNVAIIAGGSYKYTPKAQEIPMIVQCTTHGWMQARLAVFDHPYFAITDADGNFEIKLPPSGKFRLKVYQEQIGWRGGAAGKPGQEIEIKAGAVTDLKELEIGKPKKK